MPRQCWDYADGVPVARIAFQLPDGSAQVSRLLDVDCGASGGVTHLALDEDSLNELAFADGPPVRDMDVNGNILLRRTAWVLVDLPALGLRQPVLAKSYPRPPGAHDGLVTLNFLDHHFDRWSGESHASGTRRFCLERL